MLGFDHQHFGHHCNDVRLRNGLTACYRQGAIFIRVRALVVGNEEVPGHVTQRLENPGIADAAPDNLAVDHLDAQFAVVHLDILTA